LWFSAANSGRKQKKRPAFFVQEKKSVGFPEPQGMLETPVFSMVLKFRG
jgi:hypothetical protein